jgi:hypothetical protein
MSYREENNFMKKVSHHIFIVLVAALIAMCGLVATPAHAEIQDQSKSSTQVTIQSNTDKILVSAPSVLAVSAQADGTLIAPNGTATFLVNNSNFKIHLHSVTVTPAQGFNFVSDATTATDSNAVSMNLFVHTQDDSYQGTKYSFADMLNGKVLLDSDYNMNMKGQTGYSLNFWLDGTINNVTKDLLQTQQLATIDWVFAPGDATA